MTRALRSSCLVPAIVLVLQTLAAAQGVHVDKKNGFQVKPPSGWSKIPIKVEEKWIAAKWLCDRKYADKESGFEHQPMMKVIVFDKTKGKNGGGATGTGGSEGKPEELGPGGSIDLTAPYLDYKDYLKRNFQEGGFYISAEQATKFGDVPVLMLEVKIEKLVMTGKKRIMAWEHSAEWGSIAIEVDCLEQHFDKLKPTFLAAFKTLSLIKRDPNAKGTDDEIDTGAKIKVIDPNETPEQQKKRRIEAQEKAFKKAVADLPSEWTSKRTPHFLILNHAGTKFMDKVVAHAEAVRVWLDQNFDDVGTGYVQHMIIRICKDRDEENAFRRSSDDAFSSETREAVVSENRDGTSAYEFDYMGQSIMQRFFKDKNDDLYSSLPQWLDRGLSQYIGTAVLKGNRLEFAPDSSENERIREGRRLNKFKPVRDLFEMTGKDLWSGENRMYLDAQIASVFRYVYGPGRANRKVANLVKDYIKLLLEVLVENEKAARAEVKKEGGAKSEEEEEEEFKKRRKQDWGAKEKEFLGQVFKKTFDGWSDGDWAALQSGWEKFAK